MKNIMYFIIPLTLIFYGFQCNEDECDEYIFDTASLNYSINTTQSEFNVGDTIRIEYLDGNLIKLNERMTEIDLMNQEIIQYFNLFQVRDNNLPITSGTDNFQFVHNGNRLDFVRKTNEISRLISWNCVEGTDCQFSFSLIPLESGFYGIRLLHGILIGEPTCEEYEFMENRFDISDNHFEILNEINTTEINIDVPIQFNAFSNMESQFYFRVK